MTEQVSTLKLRKLKGQDTFTILRFLSKLGIKDLVSKVTTKDESDDSSRGTQLITVIVETLTEKLPDMQDDLNAFLADLTDTDVATILDLDFETYMNLIMEFIKKEELVNFIQQALQFSGMANTSLETSSTEDTVM